MPAVDNIVEKARVDQIVNYIRKDREGDISLVEIMSLAELMVGSMQTFFKELDTNIYREFRELADYIGTAKNEIGRLQANDLSDNYIPSAGEELDAIVAATESATNTIMEAAENIMEADPADTDAYQGVVNDAVMQIFEACSFQDITGQRITKIVETLQHIDDRVSRFAEALGASDVGGHYDQAEAERDHRKQELLLHGPQALGEAVSQNDIDALLGSSEDDKLAEEIDSKIAETKSRQKPKKKKAANTNKAAPKKASPEPAGEEKSQGDIDALFD
jgi:chemotaxis protein CheZ